MRFLLSRQSEGVKRERERKGEVQRCRGLTTEEVDGSDDAEREERGDGPVVGPVELVRLGEIHAGEDPGREAVRNESHLSARAMEKAGAGAGRREASEKREDEGQTHYMISSRTVHRK